MTAVHQFVRVGEGAMLGGMSGITRDIIPFGFAFGPKAVLVGLNVVGLKRRKFSRADLHRIRGAYQMLSTDGELFEVMIPTFSLDLPEAGGKVN